MAKTPSSPLDWVPDPNEERCWRLVGKFMSYWAMLESELNEGVHTLCKLSGLEAYAVTSNMGVRDKIHTVRTMLHVWSSHHEEALASNKALMNKIADRSSDRNLVAHTHFVPHAKGVRFLEIRAKGEIKVPKTVWPVAEFERRNNEMFSLKTQLRRAVREAIARRRKVEELPLNLFAAGLQPTTGLGALSALSGLLPPLPDSPGSPPPNPKLAVRMPKALRAKPKGGKSQK
jgi:hypothetical protein